MVTTFHPLLVYWDVSIHLRAADFTVPGRILPNFEPIRDFMAVLITCKNREEPIKRNYMVVTIFSPLLPYGSYLLTWIPDPILPKT